MKSPPPLRFVVLRHEGLAEPHYDLLLETSPGSALASWRVAVWPIHNPSPAAFVPLPDHRPLYLAYEGPVSGNRGTVRQVDRGTHVVLEETPERLVVKLENGQLLQLPRSPSPTTPRTEPYGPGTAERAAT